MSGKIEYGSVLQGMLDTMSVATRDAYRYKSVLASMSISPVSEQMLHMARAAEEAGKSINSLMNNNSWNTILSPAKEIHEIMGLSNYIGSSNSITNSLLQTAKIYANITKDFERLNPTTSSDMIKVMLNLRLDTSVVAGAIQNNIKLVKALDWSAVIGEVWLCIYRQPYNQADQSS